MSALNFMEKLLDGIEVEWKALGEVAKKISSGGTPQTGVKEYWEGGTIPWMSSGEVNLETIYKTENFITEAGLKNSSAKFVPKNSLVIALAGQGKTRGKVARTRIDLTTNQSLASIAVDEMVVNPDYLYHFIKTQYENLRQISSGSGTRGGLNLQMISSYKFPLPCPENPKKSLEIQAEIVRILDAFTELTAELTARKEQYNYYRDKLLSFTTPPFGHPSKGGEVEWMTLEEITLPTSNIRWRDANRSYRYIDLTSISRESNAIVGTIEISAQNAPSRAQKLVEKDDVIFATTRPTQLRLSLINEEYSGEVASTGYCVLRAKSGVVLPKWIYYHLSSSEFFNYVEENQSGSAYPAISDSKVKEFKLPIPYPNDPEKSLAEQARIVEILDKFDSLTNSISEGLPREIELRQKQYEYYRDLLLSFPKNHPALRAPLQRRGIGPVLQAHLRRWGIFLPPNSPPLEGCPKGGVVPQA